MAFETGSAGIAFLAGRVLFGAILAFMGLNHFTDTDAMASYAEMKGVPAPRALVLLSGGTLVFGGLSIVLGAYPILGAGALATFFVVTTPKMHDFWTVEDPEARQNEMIHFLKNFALLGGSLVFLALASETWPYALGIGL